MRPQTPLQPGQFTALSIPTGEYLITFRLGLLPLLGVHQLATHPGLGVVVYP